MRSVWVGSRNAVVHHVVRMTLIPLQEKLVEYFDSCDENLASIFGSTILSDPLDYRLS